jgi:hypothetical protein
VWPNPAHQEAHLDFALPDHLQDATVRLSIINTLGQEVFSESKQYQAGFHTCTWERNAAQTLAAGMYLCRLEVNHSSLEQPIIITRRLVIE